MAESSGASFQGIIGRSAAMRALFADIERFASVDVPVMIRGESGTGKELVARAVQRLSRRRDRPFETLNCADLTRELLRSELFGHKLGAFTGALARTAGLVSRVDGAPSSWTRSASWARTPRRCCCGLSKRARAARSARTNRSGSMCVSLRPPTVISRPAWSAARSARTSTTGSGGRCSRCRPCGRREDIALLVEHFRREVSARRDLGLDITGVTQAAMAILERDDWPGNVRELEAVVTRAMVRRRRGWVTPEDIVLPRLRRDRLPEEMRPLEMLLVTSVQEQALQLKAARGEVRWAELVARCRVSHEVARRALVGLVHIGLLRRDWQSSWKAGPG